uniref:Bm4838, isoform b n=1 Tax=Brugia malayi TaxID=6279 RepID=A0A1I9G1K0_BRUMA|nr:Bm4838, isoform b [Brugia malayi]
MRFKCRRFTTSKRLQPFHPLHHCLEYKFQYEQYFNLFQDRFLIIYTLVGMQWCINDANALLCWQRAKAQQIPTKTIILNAKLK